LGRSGRREKRGYRFGRDGDAGLGVLAWAVVLMRSSTLIRSLGQRHACSESSFPEKHRELRWSPLVLKTHPTNYTPTLPTLGHHIPRALPNPPTRNSPPRPVRTISTRRYPRLSRLAKTPCELRTYIFGDVLVLVLTSQRPRHKMISVEQQGCAELATGARQVV
jgi:hypothetical protein